MTRFIPRRKSRLPEFMRGMLQRQSLMKSNPLVRLNGTFANFNNRSLNWTGGAMKRRNPAREPQIDTQEDLAEIEVEDILTPVVKWPTVENHMACYFNNKVTLLWHVNGSGQETTAAID